jgi:hypothetical protein
MSFTKSKYDLCASNKQKDSNKSIFNYIVDKSRFINENECNNYTAPFLTYIPTGTPSLNIDIENDLKGMSRLVSKCNDCKYTPTDLNIAQHIAQPTLSKGPLYNYYPNNKKECPPEYDILPNKYLKK